ncbi:MAG: hypothetical protein JNL79_29085 [Myxococcales bacterium]|nr:hypothetical protein [Myxococcales bacterium]
MRLVFALGLPAVSLLVACGAAPKPTSDTPLTPGSASIQPSPVTAETVPKSTPAPPASGASSM